MSIGVLGGTDAVAEIVQQLNAMKGEVTSLQKGLLDPAVIYSKNYSVLVNGHGIHAVIPMFNRIVTSTGILTSHEIDMSIFSSFSIFIAQNATPNTIAGGGTLTLRFQCQDYYGNWIDYFSDEIVYQSDFNGNVSFNRFYPFPHRFTKIRMMIAVLTVSSSGTPIMISAIGGNTN